MYKWLTKIGHAAGQSKYLRRDDLLLKRSFTVLVIQFSGLVLAFGGNLLLARLYGEQVYGVYSLLSSWAVLLSALMLFGVDDLHIVRLPSLALQRRRGQLLAQLKWSLRTNALAVIVVSALFYILVNFCHFPGLSPYARYFNISLIMVAALTFYNNFIYFLRALDKVVRGEIGDKIIRPFIYLALLLVFFYNWKKNWLTGAIDLLTGAILSNAISLFLVAAFLLLLIKKKMAEWREPGDLAKERFPIAVNIRYIAISLLYMLSVRLDILLLGAMASPLEVGHYNVAIKFADILAYPIVIINLSLPALFSRQRFENDGRPAPRLVLNIAKSLFFQCLLLGVLFLPAGHWILGWYGKGFQAALPVLFVFFLSGLMTAFTGSIDTFFIMEGREMKVIVSRIIAIGVTAVLALLLIPRWSGVGAAVATGTGNLVYCSLLQGFFYREYGIFIHPFAKKV